MGCDCQRDRHAMTVESDIATILRRLDGMERNQSDLAASHTRQVEQAADAQKRLIALEDIYSDRRVDDARREEREKSMQKDISDVREDIKSIKGAFTKLLWIVGTAVIGAFVTFLLAGGLKIG